jgi:hypothetical protein
VPLRPIEDDVAAQADAMELGDGARQTIWPLEERDAVDRVDERPVENGPRFALAAAVGTIRISGAALKLPDLDAIGQRLPPLLHLSWEHE